MTVGQGIEIGPFTFHLIRILMAVGVVRVLMRGERLTSGTNVLDQLLIVWAIWALISSAFHDNSFDALVLRLGIVYNVCGIYFLIRIFCQSVDDIIVLCHLLAILLVPVAIEMIYETVTSYNLFSKLGRVREIPEIRYGRIRAQGPFAHSILAGTIGAVSLPLVIALWSDFRKKAMIGIVACLIMVIASASSGPIMSSVAAIAAMLMWYYRDKMYLTRWIAVFSYIGLAIIMQDPPYFILARIDLTGGSTGWHRARLIESAFQHLNEWWLAGTDYTRHWMPTGVSWSPDHTDITNYYLKMGVWGGLPLMILFIAILAKGFSFVGQILKQSQNLLPKHQFMVWALGSSLFAHAATSISVSYFDQSFIFIYLTLAAIGSTWSATMIARTQEKTVEILPRTSLEM